MSPRSIEFKAHRSFSEAAAASSLYVMFTWFPHGTNCEVLIGRHSMFPALEWPMSANCTPALNSDVFVTGSGGLWDLEAFLLNELKGRCTAKCFYVHVATGR